MNVYLNSENVSRNEENPFHNIQWSTSRQMRKIFAIKLNFFSKRREIKLQSPLSFDINMNFFDKISRTTVTELILLCWLEIVDEIKKTIFSFIILTFSQLLTTSFHAYWTAWVSTTPP